MKAGVSLTPREKNIYTFLTPLEQLFKCKCPGEGGKVIFYLQNDNKKITNAMVCTCNVIFYLYVQYRHCKDLPTCRSLYLTNWKIKVYKIKKSLGFILPIYPYFKFHPILQRNSSVKTGWCSLGCSLFAQQSNTEYIKHLVNTVW